MESLVATEHVFSKHSMTKKYIFSGDYFSEPQRVNTITASPSFGQQQMEHILQ